MQKTSTYYEGSLQYVFQLSIYCFFVMNRIPLCYVLLMLMATKPGEHGRPFEWLEVRIQMGNIVGASAFVLKTNGWTIKLLSAVPYTLSQHQFLLSHMYSHILYFSRMRNL